MKAGHFSRASGLRGMMRSGLGILIVLFCGCRRAGDGPQGPLVVATPELYIGEGKPGEVVMGTIPLENVGPTEVRIQETRRGCQCTALEPEAPFTIPPAGVQNVTVRIKLPNHGEEIQERVVFLTDDPEAVPLAVTFRARIERPFLVSPARIDFGDVRPKTVVRATFLVLTTTGKPHPTADRLEVAAGAPWVTVHRRAGDTTPRYEVTLGETAPVGEQTASVTVKDPRVGYETSVAVLVRVRPLIVAIPSVLRLTSEQASQSGEMRWLIRRTDGKPLGRLKSFQGPKHLVVGSVDQSPQSPAFASVKLQWQPSAAQPPDSTASGALEFWFQDCPEPARAILVSRAGG